MTKIHKVILVCSDKVQLDHYNSIQKVFNLFEYKKNQNNFMIVYNKQENSSIEQRIRNLKELCDHLGIENVHSNLEGNENPNAFSIRVCGENHEDVLQEFRSAYF